MRTTETTLDLTLATTTPSVARLAWLVRVVTSTWRMMVNRHAVGKLMDLTDEQLRDIGLVRTDVRAALGGTPFDAPDQYLAGVVRQRTNIYYRELRNS